MTERAVDSGIAGQVWDFALRACARRSWMCAAPIVFLVVLSVTLLAPVGALAAGPDAVMTPTGYNTNVVPRGDDTSNLVVNLPFAMNWNGTSFTQIYINMNGNCTFGSGYTTYNPSTTLAATNRNIMAPFWADVDTRNTAAAQVTYSDTTVGNIPQVNGRNAFLVNWIGVARYNQQSTPTDSFQLVLVDRSDTGAGNFDFIFNYDQITWDIATAASTVRARAGWGQTGTGFELPGSGTPSGSTSTLLDTSASSTSLIQNSMNSSGQLGRYVFEVRNGQAPNIPPELTVSDRVLEGNVHNGYVGYTGLEDATASDPDGSIGSLTNDLPAILPLGTTTVTWIATDNRGATATAAQSVLVQDTVGPESTTLSSPTHPVGVWSTNPTVTVDSADTTDVCSGANGLSYGWSQNTSATPDTTVDASTSTNATVDMPVTVAEQSFPGSAWPAGWTRSDTTYVRLTDVTGHTHGGYAAEVWADNTTRRTADFYRDYDLAGLSSATLTFWDNVVLSRTGSYARVEYSTDGGATYTQLQEFTRTATSGWFERSYALPVGGTVRVRFSGSVTRTTEYVNWDDISVTGVVTTTVTTLSSSTTAALPDGMWYFNLHAVDVAGNWSDPIDLGPFLIDRTAPVTADDAPADWSTTDVPITLTVSDAGVVSATLYSINGGAPATYSGPVTITAEGTTTLQYWSIDAAGNIETPRTAQVRIDGTPPTAPTAVGASLLTSSSVEVTWTPSTDPVSGVAYYEVYRDGSLVTTTSATVFADTGLTGGQTYVYTIVAVDRAGNRSDQSGPASVLVPSAVLWMSISATSVDTGLIDPGVVSTVTSATAVTVGGYGNVGYDLSCSALDFVNVDPMSPTPVFGVGAMSYVTSGWTTLPAQQFGLVPGVVDVGTGVAPLWEHQYIFDYSIDPPWTCEPGTYTTTVTYTLVLH